MSEQQQNSFRPGGLTPVFNEITILLAFSPDRPAPDDTRDDISGPSETLVMKNPIDDETGIVQPTIFLRTDPFDDPNTGATTEGLSLAADNALTESELLGGGLAVHVRPPVTDIPEATRTGLISDAFEALQFPQNVQLPERRSLGRIQALSPRADFPARVSIPVYYTFETGGLDGDLATKADNFSVVAKEPHYMEAVVNSIPPDPETPIRAREWTLVDEGSIFKLWIKVEAFRFLGIGDWEHRERLTYRNGSVVAES